MPDGSQILAINFFQDITGQVVGRTFFGSRFSEHKINNKSLCLVLGALVSDTVAHATRSMRILLGSTEAKHFPSALAQKNGGIQNYL